MLPTLSCNDDREKGVDSPVPTQVVSNEEFIPRPQNEQQKQVEHLIGVLSEEKARRLGLDRRAFLGSSMGMATAFLAMNQVYGKYFSSAPPARSTVEVARLPKDVFVEIDVIALE